MSEDLASRKGGLGADAHTEQAPKKKRTSPKSDAVDGEKKRGKGRPKIGVPHTVRLPQKEEDFVTELGGGILPEGVRIAVRQLMVLGRPLRLDAYDSAPMQLAKPGQPLAPLIEAAVRGEFAKLLGPKGLLTKEIGEELMEFSERLGDGDALEGLKRALRVATTMGVGAVKRLDHGSSD